MQGEKDREEAEGREGREERKRNMEVDEDVAMSLDARRRHLHTVSRDGTNN